MDNIVEGIRSRFFRTMSENAGDQEGNAQRRPQSSNSRRERRTSFEDEGSRSRSASRNHKRWSVGKRPVMPQRLHSDSSDDNSGMSSDIEAVVTAAALAACTHADGSSSSETSPVSSHAQNSWVRMPRIGEESSRSRRHFDQDANNPVDPNSRALVPSSSIERKSKDSLTPSSSMERKPRDDMALVPVPSRKGSKRDTESASGRWDKQIVPSGSGAYSREGSGRMWRNSSKGTESRKLSEITYEDPNKGTKEAKADAWLEAEIARIEHRFGMKANAIHEWESERIKKEDMIFNERERKLNVQRSKAYEQMRSKIDRVSQKAERKREKMNAKKDAEIEDVLWRADRIRSGRAPSTWCC